MRLDDQSLESEHSDYEVKRVIKHEGYDWFSRANDIALIELNKNVTFTSFIQPACLQQNNNFNQTVLAVS